MFVLLNQLHQVIKNSKHKFEDLFFLIQVNLVCIEILKEFEPENAEEFKKHFLEYYRGHKYTIQKAKVDKNLEKLVNDITIANKISKKATVYILKKKEFSTTLFNKEVQELLEPSIEKRIQKPNLSKIKHSFPYSKRDVLDQLKAQDSIPKTVQVKDKVFKLDGEYFKEYDVYSSYKQVLENDFFKLLLDSNN